MPAGCAGLPVFPIQPPAVQPACLQGALTLQKMQSSSIWQGVPPQQDGLASWMRVHCSASTLNEVPACRVGRQSRHCHPDISFNQAPAHRVGWHSRDGTPAHGQVPACRVGLGPGGQGHCAASSFDEMPGHRVGWQSTDCHPESEVQASACLQGGLAAPSLLSRPGTPGASRPGTPGSTATPVTPFNANYVPQVGCFLAACREREQRHSQSSRMVVTHIAAMTYTNASYSCHDIHQSRHTRLAAWRWQSGQWRRAAEHVVPLLKCPLIALTHTAPPTLLACL